MITVNSHDHTVEAVLDELGTPKTMRSLRQADLALGAALVWYVQEYLTRVSDSWDVDLFFESYGAVPTSGAQWSKAIIGGLNFRTDIPDSDRHELVEKAKSKAVERLRADL